MMKQLTKRYILLLLIPLLFDANIFAQCIRVNLDGEAIGAQTPIDWSPYAHAEIKLFPHPFVDSIRISGMFMQFGYNWIKRERVNVRSAIKVVMWGFVESYKLIDWSTSYKYFSLVPASFTVFPFSSKVLGIDLYIIFDPYSKTISNCFVLIVNLN